MKKKLKKIKRKYDSHNKISYWYLDSNSVNQKTCFGVDIPLIPTLLNIKNGTQNGISIEVDLN